MGLLDQKSLDMIFGQEWLKKWNANINYQFEEIGCILQGQKHTILCGNSDSCPMLNALQTKEELQDEYAKIFLMIIKKSIITDNEYVAMQMVCSVRSSPEERRQDAVLPPLAARHRAAASGSKTGRPRTRQRK